MLSLTIDVEQDLGMLGHPDRFATCEPFLRWLRDAPATRDWRTTLFVQGSIVGALSDVLGALLPRHELGLHGQYHELWGPPLWFADYPTSPPEGRRALLMGGLRAFEAAGLPRPRSFRAPNLICDDLTLDLIEAAGFELDSSATAFRGAPPLITRRGRLVRVPVSATPVPRLRRRLGVPVWASYTTLNLHTLVSSSEPALLAAVDEIFAAQDRAGCVRHLVAFTHPWEFVEGPLAGSSPANYENLVERVELLRRERAAELATLSAIAARAATAAVPV